VNCYGKCGNFHLDSELPDDFGLSSIKTSKTTLDTNHYSSHKPAENLLNILGHYLQTSMALLGQNCIPNFEGIIYHERG
jgi:hypothetical protein